MKTIYAVKMLSNDGPRFYDNAFIVFENMRQLTYDIEYACEQMRKYKLLAEYDLSVVEFSFESKE